MTNVKVGDKVRILRDNPDNAILYKNEIVEVLDVEEGTDGYRGRITVTAGRTLDSRGNPFRFWLVTEGNYEVIRPEKLPEELFNI